MRIVPQMVTKMVESMEGSIMQAGDEWPVQKWLLGVATNPHHHHCKLANQFKSITTTTTTTEKTS